MKVCALTSWVGIIVTTVGLYACGGAASDGAAPATPAAASEPGPAAAPAEAASAPAPSAAEPEAPSSAAPETATEAAAGGEPDTRTMESIAAVVKAHRKEARECYEKGLKQIPGLKGDVVIHFTLKPSGEVKQAELNEQRSTIREASVVNCVIDVIRGLSFPKSSKGMETQVNYPFNFNP